MALRVVQLGSARFPNEGLRLGTVRRPPRGVKKADYAKLDYYDIWLPALSPSAELIDLARGDDEPKTWRSFTREFQAEMRAPGARQLLDLLAALSRQANFSVGCYCEGEARCHRSILRQLLMQRGAAIAG